MPFTTQIRIQNLEVECLIGVWAHERDTPQTVRVDLSIDIDAQNAAQSERLDQTVNYAWLAESIRFILQSGRFQLLESALECLHRWVLLPPLADQDKARVLGSHIQITKYSALPDDAVAAVESHREASDYDYETEHKTWGSVHIIYETESTGFYRLNISPDEILPVHYHRTMREQEWVMNGELELLQDQEEPRVLSVGDILDFPMGHHHGYKNKGKFIASLLCMDSPPFNHDDEILVYP